MQADVIAHPSVTTLVNVLHIHQEDAAGIRADTQGRIYVESSECRESLLQYGIVYDVWLDC